MVKVYYLADSQTIVMTQKQKTQSPILDCLSDGVYACDRDRRIIFWSKPSKRNTGWPSEDVLGRASHEDKEKIR
jgi:PAS domain-containing protein